MTIAGETWELNREARQGGRALRATIPANSSRYPGSQSLAFHTTSQLRQHSPPTFAFPRAWLSCPNGPRVAITRADLQEVGGGGDWWPTIPTPDLAIGDGVVVRTSQGAIHAVAKRVATTPMWGVTRAQALEAQTHLREGLLAQGVLEPEPEFGEAVGDYVQLGGRGAAGPQMHSIPPTHLFSMSGGLAPMGTAAPGPTYMWLHTNCDLQLQEYAVLMVFLTGLHMKGKELASEVGDVLEHGAEECSLFHWAAVALGVDPASVHRPLAHLVRAPNTTMTAHLDPDLRRRVLNYYMRAKAAAVGGEVRGARLFLGSTVLGGEVAEYPTDLMDDASALIVSFDPASQIHWVDTAPTAEDHDPDFLRELCFNNSWLASCLAGDGTRAVCMAPIRPCERSPVMCEACGSVAPSPSEHAPAWLDHFAAAVQRAASRPVRCLRCCSLEVCRDVLNY